MKVKCRTVKAYPYDMFMKTVKLLSNTAVINQTKGGNNEQFAHLKSLHITESFFSYCNISLEAMGVKTVNESP